MGIVVDATLLPGANAATHVVGSSIAAVPHIVERESECGALKVHAPLKLPDRIRLRVELVRSHGFDAPRNVAVGRSVVLQGEIVRTDGKKMLVSHGGMLMSIGEPAVVDKFGKAGDLVRTTITF